MFKLDGSQTAWLIYADWLEDQNLPANFIREAACEIETNWWYREYLSGGGVGGGDFPHITWQVGNSVGASSSNRFMNYVGVINFSGTRTCGSETFGTIGGF